MQCSASTQPFYPPLKLLQPPPLAHIVNNNTKSLVFFMKFDCDLAINATTIHTILGGWNPVYGDSEVTGPVRAFFYLLTVIVVSTQVALP